MKKYIIVCQTTGVYNLDKDKDTFQHLSEWGEKENWSSVDQTEYNHRAVEGYLEDLVRGQEFCKIFYFDSENEAKNAMNIIKGKSPILISTKFNFNVVEINLRLQAHHYTVFL
jgi:hypothetical protein